MSEFFPLYVFLGLIVIILIVFIILKTKQKVWLFTGEVYGHKYEIAVFSVIKPTIRKDPKTELYAITGFCVGRRRDSILLKEGSIEKILGYAPKSESPAVPIPENKFKAEYETGSFARFWFEIISEIRKKKS